MDKLLPGGSWGAALHQARHAGAAGIRLLRAAWTEYEVDRARYLAVAMIYYALVALVPLLVLLLAALGLLLRYSELADQAQQYLLLRIEAGFGEDVRAAIQQLLVTLQQGSVVATLVGVVGLVFTASVLFRHLRLSFRAIWRYAPPLVSGSVRSVVRTTLLERMIAFVLVLMGGGLLLIALAIVAASRWLSGVLAGLPLLDRTTGWMFAELSPPLLAVITFAVLFKVLPPVPLRWRHIWFASLLCAAAWYVAGELLALYGAVFGNSRSAYGAIGALLVVMLWMNIISQVLFFGAELCKVVAQRDARGP